MSVTTIRKDSGYSAHSARYAFRNFYDFPDDFEYTVENILEVKDDFKIPKRIYVDRSENYPEIQSIDF